MVFFVVCLLFLSLKKGGCWWFFGKKGGWKKQKKHAVVVVVAAVVVQWLLDFVFWKKKRFESFAKHLWVEENYFCDHLKKKFETTDTNSSVTNRCKWHTFVENALSGWIGVVTVNVQKLFWWTESGKFWWRFIIHHQGVNLPPSWLCNARKDGMYNQPRGHEHHWI